MVGQADFRIAGECLGERPAGFGPGQTEPRTIEQRLRQQPSRYGEAEELEVVAVGDLERLRRIRHCKVARCTGLLVVALRSAPKSLELEIDEAQIVGAAGNVRSETKHRVTRCRHQRYLDRSGVSPGNCAFKRLVGNPARLKTHKGRGKVVCPASKGLIRALRPG